MYTCLTKCLFTVLTYLAPTVITLTVLEELFNLLLFNYWCITSTVDCNSSE